jgi:hypothetical protein
MKRLSQKSLLLFGAMSVVCAFVSSTASAASWSPIGTTHQLFSNRFEVTFVSGPLGHSGASCKAAEFDADVVSANTLEITNGDFAPCVGTHNAVFCTATLATTGFPWTVTATTTNNVQIHGINIDVTFENTPGSGTACPGNGAKVQVTGTLTGGIWTIPGNEVTYSASTGLTAHYVAPPGTSSPVIVFSTLRDTANTLRMFD